MSVRELDRTEYHIPHLAPSGTLSLYSIEFGLTF